MIFKGLVDGLAGARDEGNFSRSLRAGWYHRRGWVDRYHPGLGASFGQPDLQFFVTGAVGGDRLIPVELKTAVWIGKRLKVSHIRPNQISWAKKFRAAGGKSGFLAGIIIESGDDRRFEWAAVLLDLAPVLQGCNYFAEFEFKTVHSFSQMFKEILS